MEYRAMNNDPGFSRGVPLPKAQGGVMLLEALVAILIFSFGILGIIGLQATSIAHVSDAKYRIDASILADQIMGQMWAANHVTTDLSTKFSSPKGVAFQAWQVQVSKTLPGVSAGEGTAPTVTITADATDASKSAVTVTVLWKPPGATVAHSFVAQSEIR